VLHLEALRADPRHARPDLERLRKAGGRAKIDGDSGQDERELVAEVRPEHLDEVGDSSRLEIGEVDGVVDVAGGVDIAEFDVAPEHEAVALHLSHATFAALSSGDFTRKAVFAQPEWLRDVPRRVGDRRLPPGRVVFTGCGTSYHAAQTGGEAVQALEAVLAPPEADLLVVLSHEGGTAVAVEAVRAFGGPTWLVTGKEESPLAELSAEVLVVTPEIEESYCHTASYTAAVAALAALNGEDVSGLPGEVERVFAGEPFPISDHERIVVVGAGRDWPTAQEAVLKLREGVHLSAEAHHTEQILHGHLAAIDETVRAFVLQGEGRAADRAADVVRALGEIGAETTLVPTEHPAVDIVRFQLLTLALAERRGVNPDTIRWDEPRWDAARKSYS
jgi:fructoselysine-6-P-deglycase FrlB-like protein